MESISNPTSHFPPKFKTEAEECTEEFQRISKTKYKMGNISARTDQIFSRLILRMLPLIEDKLKYKSG